MAKIGLPKGSVKWSKVRQKSENFKRVLSDNPEIHMGLVARKPVFGVSDKASFKPVSSTTETSQKIEISPVAS